MSGKIILLNGVSSAGKTSLAKAIQNKAPKTFYHVSIDAFIDMAGENAFEKDTWCILRKSMQNFCAAINAFYALGRNILIDVVCVGDGSGIFAELIGALQNKSVLLVHVQCEITELDAREKARNDRNVGMARCNASMHIRTFLTMLLWTLPRTAWITVPTSSWRGFATATAGKASHRLMQAAINDRKPKSDSRQDRAGL